MREAVVVMRVLATMQHEQLTPHQADMLAQEQSKAAHFAPLYSATVSYNSDAMTADQHSSDEFAQTNKTNDDDNGNKKDNKTGDNSHTLEQPALSSNGINDTNATSKENTQNRNADQQGNASSNYNTFTATSSSFSADHLAE